MAHIPFTDGVFLWNAVALSAHVRAIRLRSTLEFADDSRTMGNLGRKVIPVLEDYELEIELSQDFAAAQVDATLGPDKLAKTARAWVLRPTSAVISATNPEYRGTGYIENYEPIHGAFGEVLGTRITIVPSVAGITRNTV